MKEINLNEDQEEILGQELDFSNIDMKQIEEDMNGTQEKNIMQLESDFEGLTQFQREDRAYQTARKIRGRAYEDLIDVDYKEITNAYKLIQDRNIKSPDLKKTIQSLLGMILELHQFGEEMFNYSDNKFISDVIGTVEVTDGEIGEDTGYAGKIAAVQNYITANYHSELQDVKKDVNKKMTIQKAIREYVRENEIRLENTGSTDESAEKIVKSILGYDVLDELMTQPTDVRFEDFVEEIRMDDYNDIRIIRGGKEERTNLTFQTPQHALLFANKLVRDAAGAQVNFSKDKPYARFRIGETTRVSIMRDPIAIRPNGLAVIDDPVIQFVIRHQRSAPFTPEFLVEGDSISEYGNEILKVALKYGVSGCMYGGTGTGKTAMFTAYAHAVDKTSRLATFAEVDEMQLRVLDEEKTITKHFEETRYRPARTEQVANPDYKKAKNSAIMWESPNKDTEIVDGLQGYEGMLNAVLTFSPDAIFLQETKGTELVDLMSAAASGHQTWTTIHAKNFTALPKRMVIMAQAKNAAMSEQLIKSQIVDAFPLLVGCKRFKDGSRRISSIVEFTGYDFTTDKFEINKIMDYKVLDNIMTNDGMVTRGKYLSDNLPSDNLKTEMLENGMSSQDWRAVQSAKERSARAE